MKILRTFYKKSSLKKKYIDLDLEHGFHYYAPIEVVISKAKGNYVWDVDGKKYYDCLSGYSSANHGHLHPRLIKTITDQLDQVTLTSRAVYNDKLGEANKFLSETFGYQKSILMNTGVEAGETAVKFARRWGYEKKKIPHNQACILFAYKNYWGRTIAAIGSSENNERKRNFGPFGFNFKLIEYDDLNALEKELKSDPNIAAYMLEPLQGEGGVIVPSEGYLRGVRELCDKYNVLMICDEVHTGLGRTGKMLC